MSVVHKCIKELRMLALLDSHSPMDECGLVGLSMFVAVGHPTSQKLLKVLH